MNNPALTIGLSMVLGMLAQVGSKHLHLPSIVLLLFIVGINLYKSPQDLLVYVLIVPESGYIFV